MQKSEHKMRKNRPYIFSLIIALLALTTCIPTSMAQTVACTAQPPKHEVRAVWLTTIGGIDWPHTYAQSARSIEKQQNELRQILDQLQAAGINTILLQTRVRGAVIYPSAYEPWDGCLSGHPGKSPGYDALQFAINECHRRGMELHAWIVTMPVGKWDALGCKQLRKKMPRNIIRIKADGYMNPETQQTADYLANICAEVTRAYDVDGIHLDYIRYPEELPKLKTLSRDKGRDNITRIVRTISRRVKSIKPWVKMSCSPIGKRNDLNRYWSRGWNAEEKGCQDVERWMKEGWMDQIYPMMYFKGDNFFPFAADWKERSHGKTVSAGLGIYFLSPKEANWKFEEIQREMNVCRQMGIGTAMFRNKFLMDNIKGLYDFTANEQNLYPALVPEMTWYAHEAPAMPTNLSIQIDNNAATLSWDNSTQDKTTRHQASTDVYYNVYASNTAPVDISDPRNIIAARTDKRSINVPLYPLTTHFAITAIDRYGKESRPLQSDNGDGEDNTAAARKHGLIRNSGNTITLPSMPSTLDVEYILFESSTGCTVASRRYAKVLNIKNIPDGMYIIRSLSKKGKSHRQGWVFIKRR